MAPHIINIFLSSFPGLGLPSTLTLPVSDTLTFEELRQRISDRIPDTNSRLIITTTSNKEVCSSDAPISSLLASRHDTFLPLRLSVPLCGGKGGFGSQLRAAGGRMSSKRKKNQGDANSSNRNLDGRRLRTVNEAKALAEYLALKPEMEKKEKEARRKRWEQVVALAERREEEVRSGSKGKVNGKWVEDKEEAGERAREAVFAAMKSGNYNDNLKDSSNRGGDPDQPSKESKDEEIASLARKQTRPASVLKTAGTPSRSYLGFDEDDEFMSESDGENEADGEGDDESATGEGKEVKG